ncbi:LytTR family DNA-binding domain-containing protein [Dyadobacter chenwenxiniae]|uniref:LytTR family DNA-binding domain-containing protein n=1 Tax=Dyadobacter chenwenxiniae TaxID=2906456 RepID=A0A9X1TCT5_9BACT|nr:LytTR family DNA-binding domain-containing protein [Dyadobacter chenwenxiniae]MCF0060462.1 LytTR family DNA-binding domain-containing protein [Dyadobacter chenwenxiniae]UON86194.1 LytTR family DNA-binding domain-containing protein [Dyadobacter chenwenxiniae]
MDKMRCLAVDDEPFALEILADDIRKIETLNLVKTCRSAVDARRVLDYADFDLIFLDIHMPGLSGLQLLSQLSNPPMVILTTAFEQYAVKAFELNVVDYLLKPISFERLVSASGKAVSMHQMKLPNKKSVDEQGALFVKSEYQTIKVLYSDILYIEGMKDYVKIYTNSRANPLLTRMNVKGICALLPADSFCRVHQSYIVSIEKISAFQKRKLRIAEKEIPIGNQFGDNLKNLYELGKA